MFFPRKIACLAIICWLLSGLRAQDASPAPAETVWAFSHPLLTGQLYQMPHPRISGHPWLVGRWIPAEVSWQGQWMVCPQAHYDLVLDQVVARPDTNMAEILLLPVELVPAFRLEGKLFLRLDPDRQAAAPDWLQQGYYEQAYLDAERELLIKHEKHVQTNEQATTIDRSFQGQRILYLYQDGTFYRLRGKNSLLKLLADQKPALRRFLRRREIRFRQASSQELAGILAHYATLR